jgi:hypothetical protein
MPEKARVLMRVSVESGFDTASTLPIFEMTGERHRFRDHQTASNHCRKWFRRCFSV